jgi:hypothetical protein
MSGLPAEGSPGEELDEATDCLRAWRSSNTRDGEYLRGASGRIRTREVQRIVDCPRKLRAIVCLGWKTIGHAGGSVEFTTRILPVAWEQMQRDARKCQGRHS